MGSLEAMTKGSDARYLGDMAKLKIAQDVAGAVADKGSILKFIPYTMQAVKQGFQDLGASSLQSAHELLRFGVLRLEFELERQKLKVEFTACRLMKRNLSETNAWLPAIFAVRCSLCQFKGNCGLVFLWIDHVFLKFEGPSVAIDISVPWKVFAITFGPRVLVANCVLLRCQGYQSCCFFL